MQIQFYCIAALNTVNLNIYIICQIEMNTVEENGSGYKVTGEKTFNRDCLTFHLRRKIFIRPPRGPIDLSWRHENCRISREINFYIVGVYTIYTQSAGFISTSCIRIVLRGTLKPRRVNAESRSPSSSIAYTRPYKRK